MKLTNISGMGKALEIIGKHVDVGAFDKDNETNVGVTVIDPFAQTPPVIQINGVSAKER
ncbi:hypothetical protein THIOSC13_70051 [uncultured Thiomicrorhabdus sp.]